MNIYQIPRNSLAWMLVAQALVILPHVERLPVWTSLLCLLCGIWRVMVFTGRWSFPGKWTKVAFVIAGIAALIVGYRSAMSLDPWVGLLITMFALKLLEMHDRRDAYVVVVLAYFVTLTQFLYDQTIPSTLYVYFTVILITASLIGLNQTRTHSRPWYTFRRASVILAQSLPLMVILFVLFPRISPLWSVPLHQDQGVTGVTDVMRPGDIALLGQSDELAFRATFEGDVPPISLLYWRGLVLGRFDAEDESWVHLQRSFFGGVYRKGNDAPAWTEQFEYIGAPTRYSVLMEPTNQNWVFSLSLPEPANDEGMALLRDYRFYALADIRSKKRYELTSYLNYRVEPTLSNMDRYWYSLVPDDVNPRTHELAASLMQDAGGDAQAFVSRALGLFNEQAFIYTLKPPVLGNNGVDEFLFETRRGFCEHYAGAFVFLARAAGIPARVVVGYQGGEYNDVGNYVEVRQFDAHAWTEVWFEGEGWRRIDPTTAVAPDRIESGLEVALDEEFLSDVTLSWMKFRHTLILSEIRLQLSAMVMYWDTFVIGYTPEMQMSVLSRYLGDIDKKEIGMLMLALFFSVLAVIGLVMLLKRSTRGLTPVEKEYLRFCDMLARQGMPREMGEAPLDYAARVGQARSDLKDAADKVTQRFIAANYIDDAPEDDTELRRAIRTFRLKTLGANV